MTRDYEASPEGLPSPERRLWAAIVFRVVSDLFFPGAILDPATRRRALSWLTSASGDLALDRRLACTFAGINGDLLRKRVIAVLDGKVAFDYFPGVRNTEASLEEARAMWRAQQRTPAQKPVAKVTAPVPESIVLPKLAPTIPPIKDDPFYVCPAGHIRASRPWRDGEVSALLGPLPARHSNLGQSLWAITQSARVGWNLLSYICDTATVVQDLADALLNCDVRWFANGERLPAHRLGAALRLYLKQPTSTSRPRSDALPADVTT